MSSQPLLELDQLVKVYEGRDGLKTTRVRALNHVSLALHRGEALALVGESGSGKSTTAKMVARLERPTSGTIRFDGKALSGRVGLAYRSRVQMIFQDPFGSLNPVHRVAHHIARPLIRHGKARGKAEVRERVLELLETVGLTPAADFADKFPHECSGGQRQRVAIARALAVDPELILADEPTSMLDVSLRIGVLNLLRELKRERGIAYLFITHDLASARYFADRVFVMYAGTVVECLDPEHLGEQAKHPYTKLLLSAVPDPRGGIERPLEGASGSAKLVDPPPGCPFAPRCSHAQPSCAKALPELVTVEGQHEVRCPVVLA
ncbi:oligopeptide/dipeptide ABC transporter, ATP-binding protein [Plesiocystis pacifica SIR-1]|uniref:Oligopeptide/dipeptide ABC transporter, ATP-binding protein n=1 Tax=Plesiocystis pacifica SIR-1 TaxID=391625 RepID=A6FX45_9BACT|nr:ABC transporter ATP-binding protein [Plesiocystis pacifica]EDM81869.1 oligopeptide/dipeptide ABC transporter, ATP-binding protein [Plesiocystis pacifica SIR-1]